MQLFHTSYIKQENIITLDEERVVRQLKTVLRAKQGYEFNVQSTDGDITKRLQCSLINFEGNSLTAQVLNEETFVLVDQHRYLAVAYPNKLEKMEIIVQKCTEMGLQHIIFFPSQYSQLQELSDNKKERLGKIALEAVEQSYGQKIPEILFVEDIEPYLEKRKVFVMHQDGELISNGILFIDTLSSIVLIGPEGGRGEHDKKIFDVYYAKNISLGKTILRTETAAIVAAWELVN